MAASARGINTASAAARYVAMSKRYFLLPPIIVLAFLSVLNGRSYVLFNLRRIQDLSKEKLSKISISKSIQGCYVTTTIAMLIYRPTICSSALNKDRA
jgi:hypothetical protein